MTATAAFLYATFWLLIAAILGGIIVYLLMKNRLKRANDSLGSLKKEFTAFQAEGQKKQKEAQVEILARDKKLASIKAQLDEVQVKEKDLQALLTQKEDEKAKLLIEYEGFKTDTLAKQTELASAVADQESQLSKLKGEYTGFRTNFESQQQGLELSLDEKEQLLETLGTMRGEIEVLKGNFILKQQELSKANTSLTAAEQELRAVMSERDGLLALRDTLETAQSNCEAEKAKLLIALNQEKTKEPVLQVVTVPIASAEPPAENDKKAIALAKVREKAKNFNYSNIGFATADDKDDLKIIVGIGVFIEEKLNALGIYKFAQIARFNEQDVEQVTKAIEFFPGRITRDNWVSQAAILANK